LRKVIITAVILTLLLFFLPLLFRGSDSETPKENVPEATADQLTGGKKLRVLLDGEVHEMDVNEYIWGVVAAEMPASFELEALKAQAVAARTYAMQKSQPGKSNHADADVCGDSKCCQAYISREKAAQNWGANADTYSQKITQAVSETGSQVILYDGSLINAVFHSSSAQETLDSVEVWGGNLPYLVGVESPEGEEVPNYHTEVRIAGEEFRKTFLAAHPEGVLEGAPSQWFGEAVRTAGGSVNQITVGGLLVKGTEMRSLFGLRSACFTVETTENEVIFHVTGNGHGVGMSQYGANAMAKEGKSYQDILTWYYSGVVVDNCPENLWNS
jgi:stage II sporulation protein D